MIPAQKKKSLNCLIADDRVSFSASCHAGSRLQPLLATTTPTGQWLSMILRNSIWFVKPKALSIAINAGQPKTKKSIAEKPISKHWVSTSKRPQQFMMYYALEIEQLLCLANLVNPTATTNQQKSCCKGFSKKKTSSKATKGPDQSV